MTSVFLISKHWCLIKIDLSEHRSTFVVHKSSICVYYMPVWLILFCCRLATGAMRKRPICPIHRHCEITCDDNSSGVKITSQFSCPDDKINHRKFFWFFERTFKFVRQSLVLNSNDLTTPLTGDDVECQYVSMLWLHQIQLCLNSNKKYVGIFMLLWRKTHRDSAHIMVILAAEIFDPDPL